MHKPKQLKLQKESPFNEFPAFNADNFNVLVSEYNNLVEVVNMLINEHPNKLILNKLRGEK